MATNKLILTAGVITAVVFSQWGFAGQKSFVGRYYWGAEVESFHPCGSKKAYWAEGEEKIMAALREGSEKLRVARGKPYEPLFVEVLGAIDVSTARDGFAESYDGLFKISRVLRVAETVPKNCK